MSADAKVLIQSSASIAEAQELTGRTEDEVFHGFVTVKSTEEYHWEVVFGDQYERVIARAKFYFQFNPADQLFKRMPRMSNEAWRRLDIVLRDLSVYDPKQDTRRITIVDEDGASETVRVWRNDEVVGTHKPLESWS